MPLSKGSLKIVRINGVDLKLHYSLVFLLVYVIFIASIQYPIIVQQSGLSVASLRLGPGISGVLFALGLLLSIAIHEYGHVWVAKAYGVRVSGVTLMMLGGVSEMERAPEQPFAEFKLAIIGPLVSLAIAGILLFVRNSSSIPEVQLFSYWIGNANLALGIFNLLPAFPLDGGRALRSFLAVKQGQVKATETAIQISRISSWVLGLLGFWTFNVILILIAFFIYNASQAELMMTNSRGLLRGININEVMTRVNPISEKTNLRQAAVEMRRMKIPVLPIVFESGHIGLLSLEKLKSVPGELWFETSIAEISEPASRVLNAGDSVSDVLTDIVMSPLRALPVEDGGNVVGVIQYTDVMDTLRFKGIEEPGVMATESGGKKSA